MTIADHIQKVLLLIAFVFFQSICVAQDEEDNYEQLRAFRIKQYNDLYQYFNKSDRNFTDGLAFQFFHPALKSKVADAILLGRKNSNRDYEVSIEQDIFTPVNISEDSVILDDRPYGGFLYGGYGRISNDPIKGVFVHSTLFLGMSGPEAMGKEMQNSVHAFLNNAEAQGWDNQLGTGLILDYEVWYHKMLSWSSPGAQLFAVGRGHFGTILNYAEAGLKYQFGHFTDYFHNDQGFYNRRNKGKKLYKESDFESLSKARKKTIPRYLRSQSASQQIAYLNSRLERKFQLHMHLGLNVIYVFYDGTLEGSLIEFTPSTFTQPTSFEDPLLIVAQYGIHFQFNRFFLNFNRFIENDVLNISNYFGFGELDIGLTF